MLIALTDETCFEQIILVKVSAIHHLHLLAHSLGSGTHVVLEGLEGVGEVELGNSSLNADLCRPIRRGGGGELAPAWSLESAGVTAGETVSVRSSERIIAGPGLGREDVEMNLLGSTSEEDRVSRDLHWRDRDRDSMIRSH